MARGEHLSARATSPASKSPFTYGQHALAFVERLKSLGTVDAVLDDMQSTLRPLGFERLHFTWVMSNPREKFEELVLATRWPREFIDLYLRKNYIHVAPLHRLARRAALPFEWNSSTYLQNADRRVADLMKEAATFRMVRGFIVPIHGPSGKVGVVAMSGVDVQLEERDKPFIHLMAFYAFDRVRVLAPIPPGKRPFISEREREVLTWAAQGKSAWEIGEILKIAKRTVDEHIQTSCRKLDAVNRTQAVALALRYHLISF